MPKIISKRFGFVIPSDLHVFGIIYVRNKKLGACEGEKNDIEKLSGKPLDITKPCHMCNKVPLRRYYLFKYDENSKPIFFDGGINDYCINFCGNCLKDVDINLQKVWKCDYCKEEYLRAKKFVCIVCDTNCKLIERIKKTILKSGVLGDYSMFAENLNKMLHSIEKEIR